jgi:two-component system C4-dicarboxylate transport response regulator DctD
MSDDLSVLFVEDDAAVRRGGEQALTLAGLRVIACADAEAAFARLHADFPGIVVTDVKLPGQDGVALLQAAIGHDAEIPVILVTGHGDVSMAVQAMRSGAYDFIEKPFASERLVEVARRALDKRRLVLENRRLRRELVHANGAALLGQSSAMQRVRELVAAVGPTNADVLIRGETGSGKEVLARALHGASGRRGEFVALNCGALPESVFESEVFGHEPGAFTGAVKRRIGKIEYASGGTLFLDEIESMPLALQVKLLRVLQERKVERLGGNASVAVDLRVIAATKTDLKRLADEGKFRSDLYYRLNVVNIELPPLAARREDVPLLAAHFAREAVARYGRTPQTLPDTLLDAWVARDWPGNVRELKHAVERWVLGVESPNVATADAGCMMALPDRVERFERQLIEAELVHAEGQVARAAARLGLPKKTLYDKLARYQLDPELYRK